jgi:uncharacterized protein (TIRG00374 family)
MGAPPTRPRNWSVRLIQLTLTTLSVGLVVYLVDWAAFIQTLRRIEPVVLALAYGLFVADRVLMAYKWSLLLNVHAIRLPLWQSWSVYSFASLAGTVLPSTLGADALRVTWLWRGGIRVSATAASVVLERAIGLAISLALAVIALVFLMIRSGPANEMAYLLWLAIVALGLLLLALAFPFWTGFGAMLPRQRKGRLRVLWLERLSRFYEACLRYRAARGTVVAFTCLTVAENLLTFVMSYVLARALGIEVGILYFCAALAVALALARLPLTIDGLGVLEGVLLFLLALRGVAPADAVALALIGRCLNVAAYLPGALVALTSTGIGSQGLR